MENLIPIGSLVPTHLTKHIKKQSVKETDYIQTKMLLVKDMMIVEDYQRLVSEPFLKGIDKYDPTLARPLFVFKRPNGQYVIVDGQHTAIAALMYCGDDAIVQAQIIEHPIDRSTKECKQVEADKFGQLNERRRQTSQVDKLRVDIELGDEAALNIEQKLKDLRVRLENLGDKNGDEISGYSRLKQSWEKHKSVILVEKAIATYKKLRNDVKFSSWNNSKPMRGSIVFGLTSIHNLIDNHLGNGDKRYALETYLEENLGNTPPSDIERNTHGNTQNVIIARKIITECNTLMKHGHLKKRDGEKFDNITIGDEILQQAGLSDPSKMS